MNIKQKVIKNTTNKFRFVLKSTFVRVNRLFILVYTKKDLNLQGFTYQKPIIKRYNVIIIM